jgi:hypothetical protein
MEISVVVYNRNLVMIVSCVNTGLNDPLTLQM